MIIVPDKLSDRVSSLFIFRGRHRDRNTRDANNRNDKNVFNFSIYFFRIQHPSRRYETQRISRLEDFRSLASTKFHEKMKQFN